MSAEKKETDADAVELEAAVNEAIAACDGDMRGTIRALVAANGFLHGRCEQLEQLISRGFHRGKLSMLDLP